MHPADLSGVYQPCKVSIMLECRMTTKSREHAALKGLHKVGYYSFVQPFSFLPEWAFVHQRPPSLYSHNPIKTDIKCIFIDESCDLMLNLKCSKDTRAIIEMLQALFTRFISVRVLL